jgi:serine/threonine-protein kinase 24/25/MST4
MSMRPVLALLQSVRGDMSAHSLEALEMISKGFHTLKTTDPEIAYSLIADLLAGIHEYAFPPLPIFHLPSSCSRTNLFHRALTPRNEPLRQHIAASTPSPFTLIRRTHTRGEDGKLIVTEHVEEDASVGGPTAAAAPTTAKDPERSPIADMLYMRWMEGLKLRWPGGA